MRHYWRGGQNPTISKRAQQHPWKSIMDIFLKCQNFIVIFVVAYSGSLEAVLNEIDLDVIKPFIFVFHTSSRIPTLN